MGHFLVKNATPPIQKKKIHHCADSLPAIYEWVIDWDGSRERQQRLFRGTIWKCDCGKIWHVTPASHSLDSYDTWEPLPAAEARRLEEVR